MIFRGEILIFVRRPCLKIFSHKGKRRNPYQTQILVRDENFDQKYVSNFFIFIFLFCIYFPRIHTTSFSSQLHPPRWLEQKLYFPLNNPLYYRAPAGVSPIFRATLPTSTELISWTEKSDDQFFV